MVAEQRNRRVWLETALIFAAWTVFGLLLANQSYIQSVLDWSECPALESIPGKVSGAWVFKGTRTPPSIVFENLEDGLTIDEVLENSR
jgi:uncharacterized protein (DUF433 family)